MKLKILARSIWSLPWATNDKEITVTYDRPAASPSSR